MANIVFTEKEDNEPIKFESWTSPVGSIPLTVGVTLGFPCGHQVHFTGTMPCYFDYPSTLRPCPFCDPTNSPLQPHVNGKPQTNPVQMTLIVE